MSTLNITEGTKIEFTPKDPQSYMYLTDGKLIVKVKTILSATKFVGQSRGGEHLLTNDDSCCRILDEEEFNLKFHPAVSGHVEQTEVQKTVGRREWVMPKDPVVTREERAVKRREGSKKEQARALFAECMEQSMSRKQIIEQFVQQLGMTPAGASTYHANFKSSKW